jgi:hypothetical protein
MTNTKGLSKTLTRIFGAPFQPNMYSPGWIIEGITIYSESRFSPYEGRLNDGFFGNYISSCVYENRFPTIVEATNEPLSFPYGKGYLYGGEFFNFLAIQYGVDKFAQFFKTYGSYPWAMVSPIFPGLGLDIAAKRVYGRTFPRLFSEWLEYKKYHYIAGIRAERLTHNGWYKSSLLHYKNKIYYIQEIPIKLNGFRYKNITRIMEYDIYKKREKVFATLNSSVTTRMKLYNDNLYLGTAEIRRADNVYYNGFGITTALQRLNLNTGKSEILFVDDIRSFCILDDSLILYIKKSAKCFGSELWVYSCGERDKLLETEYLINDIETDGRLILVSASRKSENSDIYLYNPESNEFELILKTPWNEGFLTFSGTDQICFIANFDQRHHIYGLNLKNLENIVRYTKNGFVNSFVFIQDTIYLSGLNSAGFDIYKIPVKSEKYSLKQWEESPKLEFDDKKFLIKKGNYIEIVKTLLPSARLPLFLPLDSTYRRWLYGALITGSDATGENFYLTIFGYDQLNGEPYFVSTIQSLFFSPLKLIIYYDYRGYSGLYTSYPIFRRLNSFLSDIEIYFNIKSFDNYARKEIAPGFAIDIKKPYNSYFLNLSTPLERISLRSSIDRIGLMANVGISHILFDGEFHTILTYFSDPRNPDTPSISIRGYKKISTQKGIKLSNEYSHKLLKIGKGLWNPNIFFEHLFGILFIDWALDNSKMYYSSGIEFALETKICFGFIKTLPKIGFAINQERETSLYFKIDTN